MKSKQLPIGIQSFEKLINNNCLYIDKTKHIYNMIQLDCCFLSRPRRFGKSLLTSTLQALFEGKKDLFKDTWIVQSDYDWKPYPVISLDMSIFSKETLNTFKIDLFKQMKIQAKAHHVNIDDTVSLASSFSELISEVARQSQKQVVILIDEYDSPLISKLHDMEQAKQFRDILKGFYTVLKSQNAHIRFLFITGISKFSKVSIFSGLNNLKDLTLHSDYADFLGYTQQELESYFAPHIASLAQTQGLDTDSMLDKIREWYNGYRFSKANVLVYNPFSTLNCFSDLELNTYWFESATPSFLIDLMKQDSSWKLESFENTKVSASSFSTYDLENLSFLPLLFQTGYLTIKGFDPDDEDFPYTLDYPNREVRYSFIKSLLLGLSHMNPDIYDPHLAKLRDSLRDNNIELYIETIKLFIAGIPYQLHRGFEGFYSAIISLIHRFLGYRYAVELPTSQGALDAIIETPTDVYIFEYKLGRSAKAALKKIYDKRYYEPFVGRDKTIHLVAVSFSKSKRNIHDYAHDVLDQGKLPASGS